MTSYPTRKSSPRLAGYAYAGTQWYFVTINTRERQPAFREAALATSTVETLVQTSAETGFELLAYCLMPNHLHLIASGTRDDADLVRFVQLFKQLTGFRYKKETGQQLWHRSYYDHILRAEEDAEDIADYIWHNPVRAGLAADATSYAFSGPPDWLEAPEADRAEALSLQLGPLFVASARND
jgi:REP element-mobilizing transposase RayT